MENQNRNSALSFDEYLLMAVLFDIENDIISQTFGNRDIDSICSFLYDTDDHLSSFLDWLRNRIAFSEPELSGNNNDCYYK
ncbi:hypothetical protein M9Y10_011530 [Tritrichomonas musculus]|uniref:Uncharacterized protein n=2 Tax=Tritrichomonas musculus TaxID=1915356 RepID=A0ABR2ILA5_9EUKA